MTGLEVHNIWHSCFIWKAEQRHVYRLDKAWQPILPPLWYTTPNHNKMSSADPKFCYCLCVPSSLKIQRLWRGPQFLKCLPCTHEGLSLDSQHPCKNATHTGEVGPGDSLGLAGQPVWLNSQFQTWWETLFQKNKMEKSESSGKGYSALDLGTGAHTYRCTWMNIHTCINPTTLTSDTLQVRKGRLELGVELSGTMVVLLPSMREALG